MPSKRTPSGPVKAASEGSGGRVLVLPALLLLSLILFVFGQTAGFQFLNFDDDVYVTANPPVRAGLVASSVRWSFTTLHESNWHPLTWLSLMLDAQLHGMKPGPFHVTNVAFHLIATFLLLYVLWRTTREVWKSAFVAALFAIHPLHVESVAWIAERKDVLSTVFWMLTLIFYSAYARTGRRAPYLVALVCFVLGLMAKPMLVTLPLVFVLWDLWPLGGERSAGVEPGSYLRGRKGQGERVADHGTPRPRVVEGPLSSTIGMRGRGRALAGTMRDKTPFLALAIASSVMTLVAQNLGGAMGTTTRYPIGARLGNAVVTYVTYLAKTVVPTRLAIYYPHPLHAPPLWTVAGSLLILGGITALVLGPLRSRRYLLTGWFWYLVTLLPVIGLVQVGGQSRADRYTYIPLIGIFLMAVWGLPDLAGSLIARFSGSRRAGKSAVGVDVADDGRSRTVSAAQESRFASAKAVGDAETPQKRTQSGRGGPGTARFSPAGPPVSHAGDGAHDHAPQRALGSGIQGPAFFAGGAVIVLVLAGLARAQTSRFRDSVSVFEHALDVTQDNIVAQSNLGTALFDQGDLNGAVSHLQEAIRIDPAFPDAQNNLAGVLLKQGKLEEAKSHCREVIAHWPDHPRAHTNLGLAFMIQGNLPEAAKHLSHALELDPGFGDARLNLGVVFASQGKLDEAIAAFREVLRLNPYDEDARHSLARALAAKAEQRQPPAAPAVEPR